MAIAKERDVDMVLLAGDLFHENKPSRKAMYHVMRSLRANCYGEKPCQLQMLSDASENFEGQFNYVNYEDPDINVAIPVFSIHGNHDDPSGHGHLAALDLLQQAGLVNYYGRTPESDNIQIKPVLLQKGRTKLALYGMSNVRDERLYRTFRDQRVKFFRPQTAKDSWFNLMSVHQNHHAYTDTGYLPENFLPDFMDLVVWGHEHECLIDPRLNPEMGFHVMQPGSSVATSLVPGEAVPKHISLLSVTGKQFESEAIPLRTVRPFVMREIVLQNEPGMRTVSKKSDNRTEISRRLISIVEELIEEARSTWVESNKQDGPVTAEAIPLPIIRLRVDYTAPEGGRFEIENPQRLSANFGDRIANKTDIFQFHRKKSAIKRTKDTADMPEESALAALSLDTVKVEKLVREFLMAQSLTILPQNSFGDAVSQFVDKDDKHAMEMFLSESLSNQVKHLLTVDEAGDEEIATAFGDYRSKLEELFASGHIKKTRKAKLKPKPDHWDSDFDGHWEQQPGAFILSDGESGGDNEGEDKDFYEGSGPPAGPPAATRGRGRGRGRGGSSLTSRAATTAKKSSTARGGTRKKPARDEESEDEDEDDDVIMIDDDEEDDVVAPPPTTTKSRATSARSAAAASNATATSASKRVPTSRAAASTARPVGRQAQLNFSQPSQPKVPARRIPLEQSDDEISDDDDAFETAGPSTARSRRR